MMVPLRLCYLILDCLFDHKCKLARAPFKDLTDTILSGFNVSLVAKASSIHSPTDDEGKAIDDCLQSIQRNESDAILLPYTMPVIMKNIKTGPVIFSDKITILSTYGVEDDDANPGVLDTFDAFRVDALTLILNFFVILAILICFTYILERKSRRRRVRINGRRFNLRFVPWFIFRFFVKQYPSLPGNMTALKVLLTCCLLTFSYFVIFFYSSMIKTDMITVKTPRVIASYQDIVDDPSIRPYIRHTFDEYKSFKNASSGSPKKKIWERIVKMGVNRLVYNDESNDPDIPGLDPQNPFMHTKSVIISYATMVEIVKYFYALHFKNFIEGLEKRKGLYVSDPNESEKLSAIVINRMTSEIISQKYQLRMKRFFEGHFYYKFLHNAGQQSAQLYGVFMRLGKDISDADEYVNQRVLLSEPELVKPDMTYFMPLFVFYFVFCFIQFIVFLIERWVSDRN